MKWNKLGLFLKDISLGSWHASHYSVPIGEVVENNQSIVHDPAKINADPENEAWFFKLKIKDKSELDTLMNKEEYEKFSKESAS